MLDFACAPGRLRSIESSNRQKSESNLYSQLPREIRGDMWQALSLACDDAVSLMHVDLLSFLIHKPLHFLGPSKADKTEPEIAALFSFPENALTHDNCLWKHFVSMGSLRWRKFN